MDLPGLYGINANSPDAQIVTQILEKKEPYSDQTPDLIIYTINSLDLKRSLLLLSQIADKKIPMIVILTMTDLLNNPEKLDIKQLEKKLGVPVLKVITNKLTMKNSQDKERIFDFIHEGIKKMPIAHTFGFTKTPDKSLNPAQKTIERYKKIERLLENIDLPTAKVSKLQKYANYIFTHSLWGGIFFFAIMYLLFQSIYTGATPIMDGIDFLFNQISGLFDFLIQPLPIFHSLLTGGILTGVGSVVIFAPQIFLLFFFITMLEDSGYLSRAT